MPLLKSEIVIKVSEEGIRLEVDVFSLILTIDDARRLIKKLQDALFTAHQLERERKKKVDGG